MYEGWQEDADRHADDAQAGWEAMQEALQEDEAWAQKLFQDFHGREY